MTQNLTFYFELSTRLKWIATKLNSYMMVRKTQEEKKNLK